MTPVELIAAVAAEHLRRQIREEPAGILRFCILGLGPELTSAIAEEVATTPELDAVEVRIPESLATSELPRELVSTEVAVHWRHSTPADPRKRAILLGIGGDELQRSQGSVASVERLDTTTLRRLRDEWLDASGLSVPLSEEEKSRFRAMLDAVDRSRLARTIEMLAGFVARLADGVLRGTCRSLDQAADFALPALHLPRGADVFLRGQEDAAALERALRQRADELRPLLMRRTEKGEPLSIEELLSNLADMQSRNEIDEESAGAVDRFIRDQSVSLDTWNESQAGLAEIEWGLVAPVFESFDRRRPSNLGEETIAFFDAEFPDILDDEERRLLSRVRANSRTTPAISDFFHAHRSEIAHSRDTRQYKRLAARWERLVFSRPEVFHDFLEGLIATMQRVVERAEDVPEEPLFVVELKGSEQESFWTDRHNTQLGSFFRQRYHRIDVAFGEAVEFRLGRMQSSPLEDLGDGCTSSSKSATEFKFEVFWISRSDAQDGDARRKAPAAQFIWTLSPDAIALSLPDDLHALTSGDHVLLATAEVAREPVSAKGEIQQIRLDASTTLRDALDGSNGRLVSPNAPESNLYPLIAEAIDRLEADAVLDSAQATRLRDDLRTFHASYAAALTAWVDPAGEGIASLAFIEQAEAFGRLLETLQAVAFRDRCRSELWLHVLAIGIASVRTGGRAAIVAPWHPLRLAEIGAKLRQAAEVAEQLRHGSYDDLEGADLFFAQMRRNMATPYYPEVCLDRRDDRPTLLALASQLADYSLMEPSTRGNGSAAEEEEALDADAVVAARQFASVSEQYLSLQPHERANFSVVLYNAEAKALPAALADELGSRVERDADLRCDLLVSHDEPARTRRIYEQQNAAIGEDAETILSSEAARNFLSRLRVGFIEADAFRRSDERPATDIVFLQDVIARSAVPDWMPSPFDEPADLITHSPPQWSRRRPVARGDQTAAVYLACPLQPRAGQAYLDALETMAKGTPEKRHGLPVRKVAFQDTGIGRVLDRAHEIGDWVASYDALADRRLYRNRGIQIIRYINNRDTNRGLVVSTRREPRLLLGVLDQRLRAILPNREPAESRQVAERFVAQALELSGQIVMRAARHGHFAGELMGVVLSMMRVRALLQAQNDRHVGWFFLDDFATWFGQREGQIADTLAVNPSFEDGRPILNLVVTESKFVGADGHRQRARKSASQLVETVTRIARAIDPDRNRVDRQVWLERLADLMLEGMEPFDDAPVGGWDLNAWSRELRRDNVAVKLLGLSHVFVHEPDPSVHSGIESIRGSDAACLQELFALEATRRMIGDVADRAEVTLSIEERDELWAAALLSQPRAGTPQPASESDDGETGGDSSGEPLSDGGHDQGAGGAPPDAGSPAESSGARPVAESSDELANHAVEIDTAVTAPSASRWPEPIQRWIEETVEEPFDDSDRAWLEETVIRLQRALRSYDMSSEVLGSRLTPNAALVRFRGTDDLTVPKAERRRQQLLTSHALEVINAFGAPGEVVVMVRRPHRAILRLRQLWQHRALPDTAPQFNTSLLLGAKEADGELLYLNVGDEFAGQPQHAPHTLIAGETGSGKGVLVQNLLLDICATNTPFSARIRMIDPKAGVDYPWLRRMPHLDGGLVTDHDSAVATFEQLVEEMERRYALISEAGVSKLAQYNYRMPEGERLPVLWLFHDEMADWMLLADYRNAVETNVTRLSSKARAAGISIVLVTQRPDKDAVPPLIRANIGNRLVLKVSDRRNSELILDDSVAASLLGKGHLAAKLSGENEIKLVQVPFANEREIAELARAVVASWTADAAEG